MLGQRRAGTAVLLIVVGASHVLAEDVEKRFRIGAGLGLYNVQDEVPSDSGNILVLLNRADLQIETVYIDPRNASAAFNNLEIKPGGIGSLFAQYALTKTLLVEASVGYQKAEAGDVEVQAQFAGAESPDIDVYPVYFAPYQIPLGELEQIPIQLTLLGRFRPRASLNPYLGAGFGYTVIGFDPDPAFDSLSINMDQSRGGQGAVSSAFPSDPSLSGASFVTDLSGATVDARDTWTWHAMGGIEYSIKRKWSLFADVRYSVAARAMEVSFNGGSDLGIAVPNLATFSGSISELFGPVQITTGGLLDGGRTLTRPNPRPGELPTYFAYNCGAVPVGVNQPHPDTPGLSPDALTCAVTPDGIVDPGYYYAQGGKVEYDAFALQLGFRYTF